MKMLQHMLDGTELYDSSFDDGGRISDRVNEPMPYIDAVSATKYQLSPMASLNS
jgi:hypothetical protein